jgi:hypothetical protein
MVVHHRSQACRQSAAAQEDVTEAQQRPLEQLVQAAAEQASPEQRQQPTVETQQGVDSQVGFVPYQPEKRPLVAAEAAEQGQKAAIATGQFRHSTAGQEAQVSHQALRGQLLCGQAAAAVQAATLLPKAEQAQAPQDQVGPAAAEQALSILCHMQHQLPQTQAAAAAAVTASFGTQALGPAVSSSCAIRYRATRHQERHKVRT